MQASASWVEQWAVDGKTVSQAIPPERADRAFQQIETFHQFQNLVRECTEADIRMCDAELEAEKAATREAEKKA